MCIRDSTHCVVARKGHFFEIDFCTSDGHPFSIKDLEATLERVVQIADSSPPPLLPLGYLTTNDRESWAQAREELLSSGGKDMEKALERLESGAVLLCLDDEVSGPNWFVFPASFFSHPRRSK